MCSSDLQPAVRSTAEKTFALASSGIKSSRTGSWSFSLFRAWFSGRGSMQILNAPDFLVAMTTMLTHAVGSSTVASTPRLSSRFSSSFYFSLSAVGIRLGGVIDGLGSIHFLEGGWAGGIQGRVINFLPAQKGRVSINLTQQRGGGHLNITAPRGRVTC